MSRNFTPDEILIDQLALNDTAAFEELYHRYCYSLYAYCVDRLNAPDDACEIVRNVFVRLWENRQTLPAGLSVSLYFYKEIRQAVVFCINQKLESHKDLSQIQTQIIPGFAAVNLRRAKQPVRKSSSEIRYFSSMLPRRPNREPWWNINPTGITITQVKQLLQRAFNLL